MHTSALTLTHKARREQIAKDEKLLAALLALYTVAHSKSRVIIHNIQHELPSLRDKSEHTRRLAALRIDDLLQNMRFELAHPAPHAAKLVIDAKHHSMQDGVAFAAAVLASIGLSERQLTVPHDITPLNQFRDGTDIVQRFIREGHDVTDRMNAIIRDGLAHGHSDIQIAMALGVALDSIITNTALRVSTTEPIRVFRQGTIGGYKQNKDSVDGYIWTAKLDEKTCEVCASLDGQWFPLSEEMISHANCRCEALPATSDITYNYGHTGTEWFANQSPATQIAILGRGKQYLYAAGIVTLAAMVAKERTRYGIITVPLSIREMEKRGIISRADMLKAYNPPTN
jgi:SPP1 gp7 family putative phage head morphogenesis protein